MDLYFDNERPIYIQLVDKLKILIVSGIYSAGSRIPSVRELALQYKVNPNTMQKALEKLEEDKLIYTERTNGKFVTSDKKQIEKVRSELAKVKTKDYIESMQKLGVDIKEIVKHLQDLGGK